MRSVTDFKPIRRAVILAAGMGARLRPYTDDTPKPLLTVAGRPLIEHTLAALKEAGIEEAVVVVGYRGAELEDALKHLRGVSLQIAHNPHFEKGASFSLAVARGFLGDDPFLLVMSDHLLSSRLLVRLKNAAPHDACRVAADSGAWASAYVDEATLIESDKDRRVLRIGKRIAPFSALDAGAFACTAEVWTALDSAPADCDISTVFSQLVARGRLFAADVTGCPWYDVDTPEDIPIAETVLFGAPESVIIAS